MSAPLNESSSPKVPRLASASSLKKMRSLAKSIKKGLTPRGLSGDKSKGDMGDDQFLDSTGASILDTAASDYLDEPSTPGERTPRRAESPKLPAEVTDSVTSFKHSKPIKQSTSVLEEPVNLKANLPAFKADPKLDTAFDPPKDADDKDPDGRLQVSTDPPDNPPLPAATEESAPTASAPTETTAQDNAEALPTAAADSAAAPEAKPQQKPDVQELPVQPTKPATEKQHPKSSTFTAADNATHIAEPASKEALQAALAKGPPMHRAGSVNTRTPRDKQKSWVDQAVRAGMAATAAIAGIVLVRGYRHECRAAE